MSERIRVSNIEDYLKSKILDSAIEKKEGYTRIFYPGIVINNADPKNSNRIQIRIPFIDDNVYVNRTQEEGNKFLPWCSPISRNFISTPEQNSIVIVAIFDPKTPYWGRMYFDGVTDLNAKDIFDSSRLVPEDATTNNWNNFEKAFNLILNSKPANPNQYNTVKRTSYLMGLKGKGKNRITLDNDSISLYQNEGMNTQSMLKFTKDIKMVSSDVMELLSTKGTNSHYHPLFDTPVYDFMKKQNDLIRSIVQVMCSSPSLAPNTFPNIPSPAAFQLIDPLTNLYTDFAKLKVPGAGGSEKIFIN